MPNALILEYQKSVVWHVPSRLHKRKRAASNDRDQFTDTTRRAVLLSLPGWAFIH